MNIRWIGLVSGRYLISNRKEKGKSSFILSISGIAAGFMALVCVISVMNGFQLSQINRINEINSFHLRTARVDSEYKNSLFSFLDNDEGVAYYTQFRESSAIAYGFASRPVGCQIKGVESHYLTEDPALSDYMILMNGSFDLDDRKTAVIGWRLARNLNLGVGDTLTLLLIRQEAGAAGPVNVELKIGGIFDCGYSEYNSSLVYINMDSPLIFNPQEPPSLGIKLTNRFRDTDLLARLFSRFGNSLHFVSWRDYNRAFFSALYIEKAAMYLILCLIFLVVSVNIYHSMKRSVFERAGEIALLKSIGAGPGQIRLIFLLQGLFLSLSGSIIGLVAGIILSINIKPVFSFIENLVNTILSLLDRIPLLNRLDLYAQDSFYLESIDAVIIPSDIAGFFAAAILSSLIAAYLASARVVQIRPAKIMHQE